MDESLNAVNKIKITFVRVEKEKESPEGSYSLRVDWTIDSAGQGPGPFWVWLRQTGDPTLLKGPVAGPSVEAALTGIHPEEEYYVYITDEETGNPNQKKCVPVQPLFQTISNVACAYDGEGVDLSWQSPVRELSFLQVETDGPDLLNIPGRYRHGRLECDRRDLSSTEPFQVFLTPYLNDISAGIVQASGSLYPAPVTLTDITTGPVNGKVTVSFTHEYSKETGLSARLVLLDQDGSELAAAAPEALKAGEASCTLSGTFSTGFDLDRCWLRVDLCGENTVSRVPERGKNLVPLARPRKIRREYGKGALRLSWDYDASTAQAGIQVDFNGASTSAGPGGSVELPLTDPALLDTPATVRAVLASGGCKGPAAACTPFLPGYYPGEDGRVRLCVESWKFAPLKLSLPAGTFAAPLSETLASGPLEIPAGAGDTLTVDTGTALSAGDWTAFLEKLAGAGITPKGYYFLRRQLPRLALLSGEEALSCLCGGDRVSRQADLIPGLLLTLTPAAFQLQPSEDAQPCEGFVSGAPSRYEIGLREVNGTAALSLNSCLHRVQPSWRPETQNPDFPNLHLLGGPMDFFQSELRAPFARLCYPTRYLAADQQPTLYPSDSVLLLAGASLSELNDAAAAWLKDPTVPIKVPYLQTCGRGLLTLEQYVRVNGGLRTVPVGTTLGDLAMALGIENLPESGLRLTRATPYGPLPVHLSWFGADAAAELVLLAGDEIEGMPYAVPVC